MCDRSGETSPKSLLQITISKANYHGKEANDMNAEIVGLLLAAGADANSNASDS